MDYTRLGNTGLQVSRICLGCMTYGVPDRGAHPWTLDEAASRPLIRQAVTLDVPFDAALRFQQSVETRSGHSQFTAQHVRPQMRGAQIAQDTTSCLVLEGGADLSLCRRDAVR